MEIGEDLKKNLIFLGATLVLISLVFAGKNVITPEDPVKVGFTEVTTECTGIDAGVCIGFQQRDHTTYNYDNYSEAEPGTENYYRRVEAELMYQAYSICDQDTKGMEWTDQASYDNKTATEWMENENVQLLPCKETFYRPLNATK
ncbi:MAG: hypothetical protein H8Z69_03620 [Nanohaloarchaea archaeon]|nr:hypothetical protein [Candidatus Nanohaloarchaea archaeon]